MTYYKWLMKTYDGTDTPFGDLAYDVKRDEAFPKNADFRTMLRHLWNHYACRQCIEVFKESYRRYMWEVKYIKRFNA